MKTRIIITAAVFAVFAFACLASAQAPVGSFGIQLTRSAISTFGTSFFNTVTTQITRQKFPPFGGSFSCAGNCIWNVSNVVVNSLNCPRRPTFTFLTNRGMSGRISNCSMQVTADWKVVRTTIPTLSCAGRTTGQLAQFSIRVDAGPVINTDRTLKVSIFEIDIHVDEVHLQFQKGTCSLFTSLLHQMIENELKFTLNHKLEDIMESLANPILSQFNTPSSILIPGISRLWIPIASTPKITSDSMWITLQAEFSPISSSARFPGPKVALADGPKAVQKQLQALSNSLVYNSFAWSLFTDGLMTYSVQDSIVGISITLSIRATAAPTIQIVASDASNRARVDATVPVELTASRRSLGLTVNCQITAPLAIGIEGQKFVGSIDGDLQISGVKFSVTNTSIGLSLSYIEGWLNGIVNKYIVPRAETLMEQGVPFPPLNRLGFALSTPQMTSSASTIFSSANFIAVSPSEMQKQLDQVWLDELDAEN